MIVESLTKFGLSAKEAAVYKAIFELGRSTATSIAERAGINRSTAYVVLESLLKQGLLKVSELNGIQYYEGVTNAIMQITEERLKKAREELETGKKLTEELKKLTTTDISNKGGGNVSINTPFAGLRDVMGVGEITEKAQPEDAAQIKTARLSTQSVSADEAAAQMAALARSIKSSATPEQRRRVKGWLD